MEKRKILMLGGSAQQMPAIRKAKELGYYTVVCDYLPDNPGQYEADKFYPVSTTDVEALLDVARKENVEGVLAYASDPAAVPAAKVAHSLGLPSNPLSSVEALGEKHLFRDFLKANGFHTPVSRKIKAEISPSELSSVLKDIPMPAVIKPTDSSGSKGITFLTESSDIKSLQEALSHANSYSRNKILIAEQFIKQSYPYIIGGDIFVEDGKIVMCGLMDCLRDSDNGGLIPVGEMFPPSLSSDQFELIKGELQRLIEVLNIRSGEMNVEIILGKEDKVYFLEVGPRAGGNMLPIQLSDVYGTDLLAANILTAMGEKSGITLSEPNGATATMVVRSDRDGVFSGMHYDSEIEPYIYRKCIYLKEGDKVESFDGAGKAIGIIFLHFPDADTMYNFAPQLKELIYPVL